MRIRKFLETLENVKAELFFYRVLIVFLLLAVIGLVTLRGEEKTIIIPPDIDKTFWVKSGTVSPEYLEEMALFFSSLVLNVSPANIDYQNTAFLKYVDPQQFGAIRARLEANTARIKRDGISQVFSAGKPEVKGNTAVIHGKAKIFVGSQETRTEDKAYKVVFVIRKGRIYVSDFVDTSINTGNE